MWGLWSLAWCGEEPKLGSPASFLAEQVVDALADGVITQKGPRHPVKDLRLNHRVTKIEATSGGVRCHMLCTGLEGPGEQGSVGSEPKATSHDAHAVLVTLPLGVLKKGVVSFDPELPSFKKEAIDALDMGTENRVAMLFDKAGHPLCPQLPQQCCRLCLASTGSAPKQSYVLLSLSADCPRIPPSPIT